MCGGAHCFILGLNQASAPEDCRLMWPISSDYSCMVTVSLKRTCIHARSAARKRITASGCGLHICLFLCVLLNQPTVCHYSFHFFPFLSLGLPSLKTPCHPLLFLHRPLCRSLCIVFLFYIYCTLHFLHFLSFISSLILTMYLQHSAHWLNTPTFFFLPPFLRLLSLFSRLFVLLPMLIHFLPVYPLS